MSYPSYLDAFETKTLHKKSLYLNKILENCTLCPRRCGINRLEGKVGFCRTADKAVVCSNFSHMGEEPAISGTCGSGAIFFSRCNLACVYCQNYEFSQLDEGTAVDSEELAQIMLSLQKDGCHNINFITPTHVLPQIVGALILAVEAGLNIPLVYNTSGYELPEIIRLLDGIFDIYLPDMRYNDNAYAIKFSCAPRYADYNKKVIKEMFRQVGTAQFDKEGLITKGMIIRHLVLPENISGTEEIFKFISQEISSETYISLMSQYFPCFKAENYPELNRPIALEEYDAAVELMKKYSLENGWIQESNGLKRFAGIHIKRNI